MGIHDRDYYQDQPPATIGATIRRQSVVNQIILINVALYVVSMLFGTREAKHWLMSAMANNPADLADPTRWWTLVTSGFAHSPQDIMHLFGNMISLYFLGADVEKRMGRKEFLAFYLTAMVLATLGSNLRHWAFIEPPWRSLLGASGAVVAVCILYACYFPKRQLLLMFALPIPAWGFAVLIIFMNVFGSSKHIAYDVHLFGVALAFAYFFSGIQLTSWASGLGLGNRKPRLRVVGVEENDEALEREGDRLLEKVHREGEQSLTSKERKLLERYSRYLRRQREN